MKIALVSFGSLGDVHPLLAIAKVLQALGHDAVVLSNPAFRSHSEKAGIAFIPIGSESDYLSTIHHPKVWHPVDGLGVMWRYLLRPALRPTFDTVNRLQAQGKLDLVLASPVAMGARVAQEVTGLPLVTLYTAATMLRSCANPLTMANLVIPSITPRFLRRAAWGVLDKFKLNPLVAPALDALRQDLGLKPISSSIFGDWMHSPLAGWALFPDWFATASDWPPKLRHLGFPFFDPTVLDSMPSGLDEFLAAGDRPVVFAPGTAMKHGQKFYASAVRACSELGLRGVLLGDIPSEISSDRSEQFWMGPFAPFASLLPRARAVVHHGGVGTLAQALRAGIPQVAVPSGYDQFDNASRLKALCVGEICFPDSLAHLSRTLSNTLCADSRRLEALNRRCADLQSSMLEISVAEALNDLRLPVKPVATR